MKKSERKAKTQNNCKEHHTPLTGDHITTGRREKQSCFLPSMIVSRKSEVDS